MIARNISLGVAELITGILLLCVTVFVVLIGTKRSEAVTLYFDAPASNQNKNEMSADIPEDTDGEQAASIEDTAVSVEPAKPKMTVTVGGASINNCPKKESGKSSLSDLVAATQSKDPVDIKVEAQSSYDFLRGKKL